MNASFDASLWAAIDLLPPEAAGFAALECLTFVPVGDDRIPDAIARTIATEAARPGAGGAPSRCGPDVDGTVLVVLGDMADLPAMLVEAALRLAPAEAAEPCLRAVVDEGRDLALAVKHVVEAGRDRVEHRDVLWCWRAVKNAAEDPSRLAQALDVHARLHPCHATLALGRQLGLETHGAVNAAVFAHWLGNFGIADVASDICVRTLAHRHREDLAPLAELFEAVVEARQALVNPRGP